MGYSSQAGQLLLRTQTVQGTQNADIGTAGVGVRLKSGALGPKRDLMIPDPEIGGGRDVNDAYLGAVSWSGDYQFYARMNSLATMLRACLGLSTSVLTTGIATHTLTPSDLAQLPFLSIEESIGNGLEVFNYYDAVVNTFHLEADANGYMMGTAGMIAARQTAGAVRTAAPLWDQTPMTVGTNITLTYNGVALPAKSFSLDINNNIDDSDFRLGSFFVGDLTPKRREVTAGFKIRESSAALFRQATYGLPAATTPGGLTTKQALVVTMSTYETIPAGIPVSPYSITFTFPKFVLTPFGFSVSGDDIIEDDITGQALRPIAATPICTAVIKTDGLAAIA